MAALIPDRPASKQEDQSDNRRWGHIARLAVADWLEECISGKPAPFFHSFAPYSKYWKIRTDTEENDPDYPLRRDNPLERPINISRYFENSAEQPPQIFIRDGGWPRTQTNLGSFTFGYGASDGLQTAGILDDVPVQIELTCGAMDSDDTSRLVHFIDTALGPLSVFHHRGWLRPKNEAQRRWCVMLPISGVTIGNVVDVPLAEDRQKRVWSQTVTMETRVEAITWAQYQSPMRLVGPLLSMQTIAITAPDTLKVGQQVKIYPSRRPLNSKLVVDDFRKALILEGDLLLAKRVGQVVVSLKSTHKDETLAQKTVTVVP